MRISQVHIIGKTNLHQILIENGKIIAIREGEMNYGGPEIRFTDAVAFPGLINSHDHLDFNVFPQLGNRIYKNYKEWGDDIDVKNKEEINAVLKVPKPLRIQWGLYKNLLCGVTTVVDHGEKSNPKPGLLSVFHDCYSLHSLQYEKNWKWKLNNPLAKNKPYVIHVGEGTDAAAGKEIDQLIKNNLFKKKLIAVHGVAMKPAQAKALNALVWCPASNYFLLDATADVDTLKQKTDIVFGTDSTLSAGWNIWEQLRLARNQKGLTEAELFEAITNKAAMVWKLNDRGSLEAGKLADIIVASAKDGGMGSFYSIDPGDILMVVHHGEVVLFDSSVQDQLTHIDTSGFSRILLGGNCKFVKGDLPALIGEIRKFYPEAYFPVGIPL